MLGKGARDAHKDNVSLTSHNGGIRVHLRGSGPVVGSIETHNGGVFVGFDQDRSARIDANTHNGGLSVDDPVRTIRSRRHHLVAEAGSGEGDLQVETHNGGIRLGRVTR